MNPYVLGPVMGAFFGYLMGCLMNTRSIIGTASWIPTYVVLGVLWGLAGAARLNYKKEDREKGEFLTETKAYKKKNRKKRDKTSRVEK